jgi:hypothetical protein
VTEANPENQLPRTKPNSKRLVVETGENEPKYDLEKRTFQFAHRIREVVKLIPKTMTNHEDGKQVIRSSSSVGANYSEANESFGPKDFLLWMKTSRKDAKESRYG